MTKDHSATGPMLGYLYQCRYALLAALKEGRKNLSYELSIERFDDITFESEGIPLDLIQSKHPAKPSDLSDRSVDVWKTILIWANLVKDNPQQFAQTRFILVTTATAHSGSAMEKLRHAEEQRNVSAAIKILMTAATTSKNDTTKKGRQAFIDLDEKLRNLLISNIWVFDRAPDIIDVRKEIETELMYSAPLGKIEMFTDLLEGWWFRRVILGLTENNGPNITLLSLATKTTEIRDEFNADALPLSPGIESVEGDPVSKNDPRIFVRQMRLVEVKDSHTVTSVRDYYRASTQRLKWAREELLLDEEIETYDSTLRDAFQRELEANEANEESWPITDDKSKKIFGRNLFYWSRKHNQPLRNRHEQWLSAGSFQILSDCKLIGWHPDFKDLLSEEISES